MSFARDVSDKIIFMDDGIIAEEGTPDEVFNNTKSERLKDFLGNVRMKKSKWVCRGGLILLFGILY